MSGDGPTRAQLLERVADLETGIVALREDRDEWRKAHIADAEAQALSACVKALDVLNEQNRRGSVSNYPTSMATIEWGNPQFRRILKYLADRYGVAWYEPPTEDPIRAAAEAVVNEWDTRGDGGAMVSVQNQLREALQRRWR